MLGVMTGICAPAQSSAMPHAAPEPQQAARGNLCKPPAPQTQEQNLGLSFAKVTIVPFITK